MFVTNWISTTKIQKISEITNFFRHYFLSRTEVSKVLMYLNMVHKTQKISILLENKFFSKKNLVFSPKSSIFARYLRH